MRLQHFEKFVIVALIDSVSFVMDWRLQEAILGKAGNCISGICHVMHGNVVSIMLGVIIEFF